MVVICGITAWLTMSLFEGFTLSSLPLLMVFIAFGMSLWTAVSPFILGCSILALLSPGLMPWAVMASGLLSSIAGRDLKVRLPGLAAVSSSFLILPLSASIAITAVSTLGVIIGENRLRYLLIPTGFLLSALLGALPVPGRSEPVTAGSAISDGVLTYDIPVLNTSNPVVLLPAPFQGTWEVLLTLESGGTRDPLPTMAVGLGGDTLEFPTGSEMLSLTVSPGDTMTIELIRECRPLNHPVIHAGARGELR